MTKEYLKELFGNCIEGFVYTFKLPCSQSSFYNVSEICALAENLRTNQSQNIFIGLCPTGMPMASNKRAKESDVIALPAVVIDIDVKNDKAHAQTKLPATKKEALAWLETLDTPKPSMIVDTGNGLHAYWLLDTPFAITDEITRKRAKRLTKGFHAYVLAEARKKGWSFDNIGDLARLVRLPGTLNMKTDPPNKATMIDRSGQRYSMETLEAFVPSEPVPKKSKPSFLKPEAKDEATTTLPNFASIYAGCAFVRHCVGNAAELTEPEWYHMLTIGVRCEDGHSICHEASEAYREYDRDGCDRKITQARETAPGPTTCKYIQNDLGFEGCSSCPMKYSEGMTSPISLGFCQPGLAKLLGTYAWVVSTQQFCEVR